MDTETKSRCSSATHATLQTVELLENILIHLPASKLYVIRGVCRWWQQVIDNSVLLQRIMFLKPIRVDPFECVYRRRQASGSDPGMSWIIKPSECTNSSMVVQFAPIIRIRPMSWSRLSSSESPPTIYGGLATSIDWRMNGLKLLHYFRNLDIEESPAWLDMLLTDVPCHWVRLVFANDSRHDCYESMIKTRSPDSEGVTMRHFLTACSKPTSFMGL